MSWYSQTPSTIPSTMRSGDGDGTPSRHVLTGTASSYTEGSTRRAEELKFHRLCDIFENVSRKSGSKRERLKLIFTKKFQKYFQKQSTYPMLRLMLPNLDTERLKYGIRDKNIAKLIIQANGWGPSHAKAKRISNWKNSAVAGKGASGGDISSVISDVLSDTMVSSKNLTVGEINELLDKLAVADGEVGKRNVLLQILQSVDAIEIKYLIRIILKDMKLGFQHESVLRMMHEDAVQQYNSHLDLRRLCAEIKDPSVRLTPKVTLWNKCMPMLCFKADNVVDCFAAFGDADFVIEDKLDGERLIVHYDRARPDAMKLFSRNGIDIGEKYDYAKALAPAFRKCIHVDRCILDGELLGYNREKKRFTEFGENRTIARDMCDLMEDGKDVEADGRWLCFIVFDIIYVEGFDFERHRVHDPGEASLTGLPLRERRLILEKSIKEMPNRMELIHRKVVSDRERKVRQEILIKELERVILNQFEGLVLKNLDAPYILDGRRKEYWVKVKPDYCDMLNDSLDVIILAGYYGKGELRRGGVSHFMLGVAKDPVDGGDPYEFYTIGKVGTGYSLNELARLRSLLDKHEQPWSTTASPPHFAGDWKPAKTDDVPDVWYPPQHSVILEVVGAEIVRSDNWSSYYTIRFPRCRAIRYDKKWSECQRYSEIQKLFETQRGGLAKTGGISQFRSSPGKKKRAVKAKASIAPLGSVPMAFNQRVLRQKDVKRESDIFKDHNSFVLDFKLEEGLEFDVQGKKVTIREARDVVELLVKNGASNFATMPKKPVEIIVAPPDSVGETPELKVFKKANAHDMLNINFIIKCLRAGIILTPRFEDFVFVSKDTREWSKKNYDKFGDHMIEHASKRSLQNAMNEVDISGATKEDIKKARTELLREETDPLLVAGAELRGTTIYFDKYETLRLDEADSDVPRSDFPYSMLQTVEALAELHDADISTVLDSSVTHIILDGDMGNRSERKALIQQALSQLRRKYLHFRNPRVVNHNWVLEVIHSKASWQENPIHLYREL